MDARVNCQDGVADYDDANFDTHEHTDEHPTEASDYDDGTINVYFSLISY